MKRLPFLGGFLSPYFWVEIFKKKDFGVEFNLNIKIKMSFTRVWVSVSVPPLPLPPLPSSPPFVLPPLPPLFSTPYPLTPTTSLPWWDERGIRVCIMYSNIF